MHGSMYKKVLELKFKINIYHRFIVNDYEQAKSVTKRQVISPLRLKESAFVVHKTKTSAEYVRFKCLLLTYYLLTYLITYSMVQSPS